MRFVKPLDKECLHTIFKKFNSVITIEDGTIVGGLGSSVIEFMCENGYKADVTRLGIPDRFIEHGTQGELYKECGFDTDSIYMTVKSMVKPRILSNVS
jgi:1-deoxy-D-xylulose-5-phosphate synthase